jgi:HEAT repeat protein
MLALNFIWLVTEVLALLSLGTMLVLILRRFLSERRDHDVEARLRELQPVLFHCLERQASLAEIVAPLGPEEREGLVVLARRLINALTGESRQVLVGLLEELGYAKELLTGLRRGGVPVRLQAATELAFFQSPEVRTTLRAALRDRFYGVRVAAAISLVELGDYAAEADIVHFLTDDVDPLPLSLRPLFRKLAAHDVRRMEALAGGPHTPVAVLAIDALSGARAGLDLDLLCRLATVHPDKNARAAAQRSLGLLAAVTPARDTALPDMIDGVPHQPLALDGAVRERVERAVRQGLSDRDWEVRTQSVVAAQRMQMTGVIPRLLAMQSDPQWWVRFRCTQALRSLGLGMANGSDRPAAPGRSAGPVL